MFFHKAVSPGRCKNKKNAAHFPAYKMYKQGYKKGLAGDNEGGGKKGEQTGVCFVFALYSLLFCAVIDFLALGMLY